MMVDVVIPLAWHSTNDYLELRYALRSLEKHMLNVGNVFIIGHTRPAWLTDEVTHIKKNDTSKYASVNIKEKLLYACDVAVISDPFLLLNDDHFLLRQFDAAALPFYYNGLLVEKYLSCARTPYGRLLENTIIALERVGAGTRHFDIHCPVLYEKRIFKSIINGFDWSVHQGYGIKSLYCNVLTAAYDCLSDKVQKKMWISDIVSVPDLHIAQPIRSPERLEELLEFKWFFSTFEGVLNDVMMAKLNELYPNPSKYES
jgi:hypothetical protein